MLKILIIIIIFISQSIAQQKGVLTFKSSENWTIQVDDSLNIDSTQPISLKPGKHFFKARPQISYNWPATFIEDSLVISENDTTFITLHVPYNQNTPFKQLVEGQQNNPQIVLPNSGFISENRTKIKSVLILSAVAANWMSFYLKRQADNYYDRYKGASSLKKLNNYYDKTQQFDTLSGVMLGVSAAALSGFIYLTLTE